MLNKMGGEANGRSAFIVSRNQAACRVVSVFPKINLSDFVAQLIFQKLSHRQFATGVGRTRFIAMLAPGVACNSLLVVEFTNAAPATRHHYFETGIDTVHLGQFPQALNSGIAGRSRFIWNRPH